MNCHHPNTEYVRVRIRALFGEEAYVWPTSWLCPACHGRWHQTIKAAT